MVQPSLREEVRTNGKTTPLPGGFWDFLKPRGQGSVRCVASSGGASRPPSAPQREQEQGLTPALTFRRRPGSKEGNALGAARWQRARRSARWAVRGTAAGVGLPPQNAWHAGTLAL